MSNTELARQILERNGEMRAMDVGAAILAAGAASTLTAAQLGGGVCRDLAQRGLAVKVRRGVYAALGRQEEELVGIPKPGGIGSGQMARLIAAADEYGREIVAAMDLAGPGMEDFLAGAHRELSRQVAILQQAEHGRYNSKRGN